MHVQAPVYVHVVHACMYLCILPMGVFLCFLMLVYMQMFASLAQLCCMWIQPLLRCRRPRASLLI